MMEDNGTTQEPEVKPEGETVNTEVPQAPVAEGETA
jgi:hypothetical protein